MSTTWYVKHGSHANHVDLDANDLRNFHFIATAALGVDEIALDVVLHNESAMMNGGADASANAAKGPMDRAENATSGSSQNKPATSSSESRQSPVTPLAPLEFLQNQRRGSITDPSLHAAGPSTLNHPSSAGAKNIPLSLRNPEVQTQAGLLFFIPRVLMRAHLASRRCPASPLCRVQVWRNFLPTLREYTPTHKTTVAITFSRS